MSRVKLYVELTGYYNPLGGRNSYSSSLQEVGTKNLESDIMNLPDGFIGKRIGAVKGLEYDTRFDSEGKGYTIMRIRDESFNESNVGGNEGWNEAKESFKRMVDKYSFIGD